MLFWGNEIGETNQTRARKTVQVIQFNLTGEIKFKVQEFSAPSVSGNLPFPAIFTQNLSKIQIITPGRQRVGKIAEEENS